MTPEESAQMLAEYPDTPNDVLAQRYGISIVAVRLRANRRGVRKSPEYQGGIQRERMLNRKHSEQTINKIRAKAIGREVSEETRAKRRLQPHPRGSAHPNWKGGRPWERFKRPEYLQWRNAVLERDNYTCQQCGRQCNKNEKGLAAHHIQPYALHPNLRYDVSNGLTLCRTCHMALHGRMLKDKPLIECACGCGTLIESTDRYGRQRRYALYHSPNKGKAMSEETKQLLSSQRRGKTLKPEHRRKIAQSLRSSEKRIGRPPKQA